MIVQQGVAFGYEPPLSLKRNRLPADDFSDAQAKG